MEETKKEQSGTPLSVDAMEKLTSALILRKTIDGVNTARMTEARLTRGNEILSSEFLKNYTILIESMAGEV